MDSPSRSASTLSRRQFLRIAGLTGLGALASTILRIPPVQGLGRLAAPRAGRRSAYWSDPETWGGKVPGKNDRVVIYKRIVLDVDAQVRGLVIKSKGRLVFHPRRSVTLRSTGNVVVRGRLTMRASRPSTVHSLLFLRIDERRFAGSGMKVLSTDVGLWVMGGGVVNIAGAPKLAWTRTTEAVTAGATTITLRDEPLGWRVGDEVILTPTLSPSDSTHHVAYDTGTVAAVDLITRRITLSSPTKFAHPTVQIKPGVVHTAEVLNLTRNVRIEGTPTGRSHIFVHSSRAQFFRNASLRYMGPRQPFANGSVWTKPVTGRYGLHFHTMNGASRGSMVQGVVVRDSGNHAFVAHQSHGVTFRDCVTHDTFEDAYWWDPSPHMHMDMDMDAALAPPTDDVLYERCVASLIRTDPPTDGFFRLAGFFLGARKGNVIRDCVAVGVQGGGDSCGFHWPERSVGLWKFENCVAHNNHSNGITVWQNNGHPNVVSEFTAYHNGGFGVRNGQYANGFMFEDSVLYGNKAGAILSNAASFAAASQRFIGLVCDQAGLSSYCVLGQELILAPKTPVQFVDCQFRGYGKAAFGFIDPVPFPNDLNILNCAFEGNEFWLATDVHPATLVRVQDPFHGTLTVRRADQPGTFRPEWNASVSNISG